MVNSNGPINPFMSTDESIGDTVSIWTLFSHTAIYVTAIGSLIPVGLGIFCCYFFCEEEHFPTAPLDDDILMDEPVLDRHLCIHEHSQPHDLCPYPCLDNLDQVHLTLEYALAPQYMDLSDLFSVPDVMTAASDKDISSLEDVFEL